jgi:hypothetical protein
VRGTAQAGTGGSGVLDRRLSALVRLGAAHQPKAIGRTDPVGRARRRNQGRPAAADRALFAYANARTSTPADPDRPALLWSAGGVMLRIEDMRPAGFGGAGALLESECSQLTALTRRRRLERPHRSPSRRRAQRSLLSWERRCSSPRPRLLCSRDNVAASPWSYQRRRDRPRSWLDLPRVTIDRSASLTCSQRRITDPRVVGPLRLGKVSLRVRLQRSLPRVSL